MTSDVAPVADAEDTRPPGRPRDPDLEARAHRAVLEVFGEKGWAGLTIDEVASRAHVGKSSIYLRWKDKAGLLAAALESIQSDPGTGDGSGPPGPGTLREFLVRHAHRRADLYLSGDGLAMLRLYVETRAFPEVFAQIRHTAMTRFVLSERRRVAQAIEHGELPSTASAVQLLDAIEGAILMHVLVTPPHPVEQVRAGLDDYIEHLVSAQLAVATQGASGGADAPGEPES